MGNERLECDLIMKGGITSGVVYPPVVATLSKKYAFRRIGGSSAGAIAAVLTAAAEYRRRAGMGTVYERVARIPEEMTKEDRLLSLFQPDQHTRAVFRFLLAVLDKKRSLPARLLRALGIVIGSHPLAFAVVLALVLVPAFVGGLLLTRGERVGQVAASVLFWVPGALLLAMVAVGAVALIGAGRVIVGNGFGLTKGFRRDAAGSGPSPLTTWLDDTINEIAGETSPLTYRQLWGPTASAWYDERIRDGGTPALRALDWLDFDPDIDLKVMTTCLTQGMPYAFPFGDDAFHYCRTCWADYFPDGVMAQLAAHDRQVVVPLGISRDCPRHPGEEVRRLPHVPDLPIVIAARLSLSFPLLISAVPLVYFDLAKREGRRGPVVAWFSDGGITSNFPVHFFDVPLPGRPTFGINLIEENPGYPSYEGGARLAGAEEERFPVERPITTVLSFLGAVMDAMQNWSDTQQSAAPGYRDRIVEVAVGPDEGGLNLSMSEEQITSLAAKGQSAGERILADFDFDTHRWMRFRTAMNGWGLLLDQHQRRVGPFLNAMPTPWTGASPLADGTEAVVRDQAIRLAAAAKTWGDDGWPGSGSPPQPEPSFRLSPRR